jgi:hypothetical protein
VASGGVTNTLAYCKNQHILKLFLILEVVNEKVWQYIKILKSIYNNNFLNNVEIIYAILLL